MRLARRRVVSKPDLKNIWGFFARRHSDESCFPASFLSGAHHKVISAAGACVSPGGFGLQPW